MTRGDVQARVRSILAGSLLEITRRADDWLPGDVSYVIVDAVTERGETYVQLLADPAQDGVLCEVSSGVWSPEQASPDASGARALSELGFELRPGGNYGRVVSIRVARDATNLARELIDLLHDALGYRGDSALTLRVQHARAAR